MSVKREVERKAGGMKNILVVQGGGRANENGLATFMRFSIYVLNNQIANNLINKLLKTVRFLLQRELCRVLLYSII